MKLLSGLLMLFVTSGLFAQDTSGSFIVQKGSVLWKHTFSKQGSFQQLVNSFKRAGVLTNIDTFENTIVGQSVEAAFDFKGAGYTRMNAPMLLLGQTYKSAVVIDYTDSCYTVTVSKIMLINQTDTKSMSPLLGSSQGDIKPIEDYAIKKAGDFTNMFADKKPIPKIMDFTFNKTYGL